MSYWVLNKFQESWGQKMSRDYEAGLRNSPADIHPGEFY